MSLYDNPDFFASYAQMSRSQCGLDGAGEWQQFQKLFPDLKGKTVLDLGCGYGWHSKYAVQMGAEAVTAIDTSAKMIETAKAKNADARIDYQLCDLRAFGYPENTYDVVISNLVLHYIEDLDEIYRKVFSCLKSGGSFLFNIEHPTFTAGVGQEWITDENGTPLYWPVDDYFYPTLRQTMFLGHKVEKYHHTLTQILMGLKHAGFTLEAVEDALPPPNADFHDEMRRPMMLLVRADKP